MYKYFTPTLFLLLFGSLTRPASAQNVDSVYTASVYVDSVYVLPDLTVVATRFAISVLDAPTHVTLIDRAAFADPKARSVADVMARHSGVFVRQYGPGGLSTLSARGSTSSQSLILIDGLPLSNPQLGQVDLAVLPSSLFQSADVVAGAASAQYGSAAVGSVINLRTHSNLSVSSVSAEFQSGSFAERGLAGSASHSIGTVHGSLSLSLSSSDGDFRYRNAAAFPVRWDRRENADVEQKALLASVSRTGRLSGSGATLLITAADRGLPAIATVPSNGERQADLLRRVSVRHRIDIGRSTATVRGYYDRASLRYVNPTLGLDETGTSQNAMIEGEYQRLDGSILSSTGVSIAYQLADHPSIKSDRVSGSGAAFTSVSIPFGRLLLYPAVRLDIHRMSDLQTFIVPSPRVGVNAKIGGDSAFRLKANGGRSFRVPTFNDWYWQGPGARGNRDLRPEDGWSGDIGFHYARTAGSPSLLAHDSDESRPGYEIELTSFASIVRDQIVWMPGADAVWKPENVGEVRARGIELETAVNRVSVGSLVISTRIRYSYTNAREFGADEQVRGVRYVPKSRIRASGTVQFGEYVVDAVLAHASKRLVTTDGLQSVPSYRAVDLTLSRTVEFGRYRMAGHASVLNLFSESYAVVKGYPMPPRSFRLTFRVER